MLAHIGGLPLEEALGAGPGLLVGAGALVRLWRSRRWPPHRGATAAGVPASAPAAQAKTETSAP